MSTIPALSETDPALDALFAAALRRLLADEPLAAFCDWFSQTMGSLVQAKYPLPPGEEADGFRYQRAVARALWAGVPVPSNRWRPRSLPRVERNDPCHCGSGRKFKQCCAEFAGVAPPFDSDGMYALALAQAEPAMLTPDQVRLVPPLALGMAAEAWNQDEQPDRTVAVLEPLFRERGDLDDRHELAFDMLMDALQALGQETRRHAVAQHVSRCRDKTLATAARCRLVSMLADRGEMDEAWSLFQSTQRLSPNDGQLWHLELTLLLSQGRLDEARLRGPVLAARARKAGMAELSDALLQLAEHGFAGVYDAAGDDGLEDEPLDAAWIALCDQSPESVSPDVCRALYRIEPAPTRRDIQPPTLRIKPARILSDLQRRWRRRFAVEKPILTELQGDASVVLDAPEAVADFLHENPQCWLSIEVLDDLLLASAHLCDPDSPPAILRAARRLASHAVAVLRVLVGEAPARLDWADSGTRPLLRVLAQAIEIARLMHDQAAVEALARWSLALNPSDNHGWRGVLVPRCLSDSRFDDALALLERYPDDLPPAEHHRALALFALGRTDEAQAVLRAAHAVYPRFLQALLPALLDQPEPETGPGLLLGGAMAAWHFRVENRPVWHRTGALAWAKDLNLPAPPTRKAPKPKAATSAKAIKAPRAAAGANRFSPRHEAQLREAFPDYPHLHGLLMAVAWAPELIMPIEWLHALTDLRVATGGLTPAKELKAMNADLEALMHLYNSLNDTVLATLPKQPAPLQDVLTLTADCDRAVFAWAAGFVRGAELAAGPWRRAGRPVSNGKGTFGELYALAARASLAPETPWRARKDDGQPLLIGLEDAPEPPSETLKLALLDLWRVIAPLRHAQFSRANPGSPGSPPSRG